MNLLIEADLVNPPTLLGSFRDLTFFATLYPPHYDVLIKCEHEYVDIYYKFLKNYVGGMDYIKDFVYYKEPGLYIDCKVVDRITPETLPKVLKVIGFMV
jgi:hypothetical protein